MIYIDSPVMQFKKAFLCCCLSCSLFKTCVFILYVYVKKPRAQTVSHSDMYAFCEGNFSYDKHLRFFNKHPNASHCKSSIVLLFVCFRILQLKNVVYKCIIKVEPLYSDSSCKSTTTLKSMEKLAFTNSMA